MSLQLKIITPERLVFEGSVDAVRLPGLDGDFGVLDNHAPLISGIAIGALQYDVNGQRKSIKLEGGFVEVSDNVVSVLADSAQLPE